MRTARSRSIAAAATLALLAVLGIALVEATLVHTDDGCAVEIHCLACRFALSATVVTPPRVGVEPALAASGWVTLGPRRGFLAPRLRAAPSRGPPASFAPLS
jgi:hypothetical protein